MGPRRWIHCCNPALSDLLSETLGGVDEWITSLENLQQLVPYATDKAFQDAFIEYKRQNMNILYVIHRYLCILDTPAGERKAKFVPRVVCIGGKAAPGYHNAKAIIKLITSVQQKVNNDHS